LTKCKIGLPYPGGPLIDKYAQLGNPKAFAFTKQKFRIEFQFSGLKQPFSILFKRKNRKSKFC
jgi:N6-L-threonylcarbamoyladenine synthase